MKHAKLFAVTGAASLIALIAAAAAAAAPAQAANTSDTTTTFTVSGGALNVSAPASKDLGTGAAAGTLTAQLGAVTVTDARAQLGAAWTATVSTNGFTNSTVSGADPITTVTYSSGLATATTGIAVFTPGQALNALPAALSSTGTTAYSASASTGNNSATWNPTIVVTIPAQAIAGAYTGTITHSVS